MTKKGVGKRDVVVLLVAEFSTLLSQMSIPITPSLYRQGASSAGENSSLEL